jgi:type II secretory pathway pseudopilin PulG
MRRVFPAAVSVMLVALLASAQAVYQPKFKGDPARSDSEAAALGYMRTFLRAQKLYKKKNAHYATSLMDLSKTGSFTRRMASTNRGDYTVKFRSHKDKDTFEITMVPKQLDAEHRSFFADEDGTIRGDDQKEADESSPIVR